jgi:succinate-semialdehyde dehydrogenase/glutarate-semialdehyde dehydrogenase
MNSMTSPALSLLRQQAYINGQWLAGAQQFAVHNPASGALLARVADLGAVETCRHCRRQCRPARLAGADCTAARRHAVALACADPATPSRTGRADQPGTRQTAGRKRRRNRLRCQLYRVVCRRRQTGLWRGDSQPFADKRLLTVRQGVGVVAAITPWNFPTP